MGEVVRPRDDILELAYKSTSYKSTPIIMINRDQHTHLQRLVAQLHAMGYYYLYIVDNASKYKPLLAYYKLGLTWVIHLPFNAGNQALWETDLADMFQGRYVLTDADLVFTESAPDDWLEHFWNLLDRYPVTKVGAALKIDDLPSWYPLRDYVRCFEAQNWLDEIRVEGETEVYRARIDTTLALYRQNTQEQLSMSWLDSGTSFHALRVAGPYTMRHLPWYEH